MVQQGIQIGQVIGKVIAARIPGAVAKATPVGCHHMPVSGQGIDQKLKVAELSIQPCSITNKGAEASPQWRRW
jgi:hypothetical protein